MDDAKNQWGAQHTPGKLAVFQPGQELRCPCSRELLNGTVVTCSHSLHIWARSARMVVRPRTATGGRIQGSSDFHCRSCHHWSEVYTMRETLEATG